MLVPGAGNNVDSAGRIIWPIRARFDGVICHREPQKRDFSQKTFLHTKCQAVLHRKSFESVNGINDIFGTLRNGFEVGIESCHA